jgi:hypothetical protein
MKTRGSELGTGAVDEEPENEELRDDMTSQLDRARRRLETLHTREGQYETRTPTRRHRRLEALDLQHDAIRDDMLELRKTEGTAWEALRGRIKRGLAELERGIKELQDELTD